MRRVLLLAILVLHALPARGEDAASIEQAWRAWMARHQRASGGIAILHRGVVVHEASTGGEAVSAAVPLASLSKAVTGVCIAGLIDGGRLSFATPLSQSLERTLKRVGPPADRRLLDVTIEQLLVHRVGFDRDGKDPGSGSLESYLRSATATRPSFDVRLKAMLERTLTYAPGERYAYSNPAYLVLGAIIEEASGQPYEAFCRNTVLTPLGARGARLDPAWRILSSFGGWQMPLGDYGRFYQAFAQDNPAIGPVSRRWMMSAHGKEMGNGVHYGLGTFVRPTPADGGNFWHWGAWNFHMRNAYDGPLASSYSTYAVRLGALDVNMVVHMEPVLGGGTPGDRLDDVLGKAARAVTRWP